MATTASATVGEKGWSSLDFKDLDNLTRDAGAHYQPSLPVRRYKSWSRAYIRASAQSSTSLLRNHLSPRILQVTTHIKTLEHTHLTMPPGSQRSSVNPAQPYASGRGFYNILQSDLDRNLQDPATQVQITPWFRKPSEHMHKHSVTDSLRHRTTAGTSSVVSPRIVDASGTSTESKYQHSALESMPQGQYEIYQPSKLDDSDLPESLWERRLIHCIEACEHELRYKLFDGDFHMDMKLHIIEHVRNHTGKSITKDLVKI
ncbi:hypothetical protein CVT24_007383 [Panaeolus cyanescens]|uniref:Uncharacterized protein n=1 Tax=Panaeolus cyanescens TaxID=181874 RepID=A0A409YL34_9AGAR|nr:hypothetical protein CVT24_007383 [Panaeolus cyanescens]